MSERTEAQRDRSGGMSAGEERESLPVVGIGASAGGVGALRQFFDALPDEVEAAFVVIIHLAPDRESHLSEVLERSSGMPVAQVSGPTALESKRVYVIPPDKKLEINEDELTVSSFNNTLERRAPIDIFFRTLAEAKPDSIAVLFSGGGTDGTVGMRAIKEAERRPTRWRSSSESMRVASTHRRPSRSLPPISTTRPCSMGAALATRGPSRPT